MNRDDGSDFGVALRFLQHTVAEGFGQITVTHEDAKAICREIMRLQDANARLAAALESCSVDAARTKRAAP